MLHEELLSIIDDRQHAHCLWSEITELYSSEGRHYHNLQHLDFLYNELSTLKTELKDWPAICLAICYHDIIYHPGAADNEDKSAELAEERLSPTNIKESSVSRCKQHILATKLHANHTDPDTNLFTDADLAILGQNDEVYDEYAVNIRREYSHVPDALYGMGRGGVLQRFLRMERIFKTEAFFTKYEVQARKNIRRELQHLTAPVRQ